MTGVLESCATQANNKMDPPAYNDMSAASIPQVEPAAGIKAKVIVGCVGSVEALIKPVVQVQYVDFMCAPGAAYEHTLDSSFETCIVHVYRGEGTFGADKKVAKEGGCILFGRGETLAFAANATGVDFLLLAGVPLREPCVWARTYERVDPAPAAYLLFTRPHLLDVSNPVCSMARS